MYNAVYDSSPASATVTDSSGTFTIGDTSSGTLMIVFNSSEFMDSESVDSDCVSSLGVAHIVGHVFDGSPLLTLSLFTAITVALQSYLYSPQ